MGRPSKRAIRNKEAIKQIRENNILYAHELEKDKLRKKLSRVSQDIVVTNQRKKLNLKCSIKRLQNPDKKKSNQIASLKRLQDPIASRKSMDKRLQDPVNKKKNQIASRKSMDKRLQDPVNQIKKPDHQS
ncbi:hypothetical protein ACI65C_004417 [Semiaphis heraclei]